MRWVSKILSALFLVTLCSIAYVPAAEMTEAAQPKKVVKHGRGRVVDPLVTKRLHESAKIRHRGKILPHKLVKGAVPATFDCRAAFPNVVLATNDQAQCGDCFNVSAVDGVSMALIMSKQLPYDPVSGRLSSQYMLDSGAAQGGCDGGDEAQVIDYAMTTGIPLTSAYGPYSGSPGRVQNTSGMTFYKLTDYGYCTPNEEEGIAATSDIKTAMMTYGPISWAGDASEFDNYQWPGTIVGRGTNVDHATLVIGWDDTHDNGDGTKGAWIGKNQWGGWSDIAPTNPTWVVQSLWSDVWPGGPSNTFWIKYGADSWGTEAIWMVGGSTPPVTPIPPVGPTPIPPPTPTPVPPTPVPCTPTFHLIGRPHMRCATDLTKGLFGRIQERRAMHKLAW